MRSEPTLASDGKSVLPAEVSSQITIKLFGIPERFAIALGLTPP